MPRGLFRHRRYAQSVDAGDIHLRPLFAAKAWRLTQINLLFAQILQLRLQLGIALGQVACDIVIHSQRLTQYEHIADGRNQGTQ